MPPCNFSVVNNSVKRSLAPYFGGKWRTVPWLLQHFPHHRTYIEPYGGAASCLIRKPRTPHEIYNDLNSDIVALFRILRDPEQSQRLLQRLYLTPFSREEYVESYVKHHDPIEQARRTLYRLHAAFGGDCHGERMTGFKTGGRQGREAPSWARLPEQLEPIIERLRGVIIENRPALQVIQQYDAADALIYCDPPYVPDARETKTVYKHEMSDLGHRALANVLHNVKGMVVLSGYPSDLYNELYGGWECYTKDNWTFSHQKRTEALWLNPAASAALKKEPAVVSHAGDDRAADPLVGPSPAVATMDDFDDYGTLSAG